MEEVICNTSECGCTAVAYGVGVGEKVPLCIRCAIKIQIADGPEALETIPGAVWPWDNKEILTCPNSAYVGNHTIKCGAKYTNHLKGQDHECPTCRRNLP